MPAVTAGNFNLTTGRLTIFLPPNDARERLSETTPRSLSDLVGPFPGPTSDETIHDPCGRWGFWGSNPRVGLQEKNTPGSSFNQNRSPCSSHPLQRMLLGYTNLRRAIRALRHARKRANAIDGDKHKYHKHVDFYAFVSPRKLTYAGNVFNPSIYTHKRRSWRYYNTMVSFQKSFTSPYFSLPTELHLYSILRVTLIPTRH